MEWLIWSAVFIGSVALLVKSADIFVESADKVGAMLGVSAFIMGITLVALGTSLPELAASLVAVSRDETEFIIGNAVGSNAANILLVLGATAMVVRNYRVERNMNRLDLPALAVSAGLVILFCLTGRTIVLWEGVVLLAGYAAYLTLLVVSNRLDGTGDGDERPAKSVKPWLLLVASGVGIYFGAEYTLVATINLSKLAGFADTSVLALSAVAIGTSLPELTVSVAAARKGQLDLAVGNVVGSNIFNSLAVIGLPALLTPLAVSNKVMFIGLPFMALATALACLTLARRRVARPVGAMLLVLFIAFVVLLFVLP